MQDDQNDNVVKISEVRKRQRTTFRKGASGLNGAAKPKKKQQHGKIWVYVQFVLFMLMFAYVMSTCGGGI